MKKYVIIKGTVTDHWNKSEVNASELLADNYQLDYAETIFETFDKAEAEAEFVKYKCDCTLTKTNTGYQANIEYYDLETQSGEIEDGDFEMWEAEGRPAPFIRDVYKYNG